MLIHEDQFLSLSLFSSRLCFPLPIISSLPIPIIFYFSSSHRIAIHMTFLSLLFSMFLASIVLPTCHSLDHGQWKGLLAWSQRLTGSKSKSFFYHNRSKQGRTNSGSCSLAGAPAPRNAPRKQVRTNSGRCFFNSYRFVKERKPFLLKGIHFSSILNSKTRKLS